MPLNDLFSKAPAPLPLSEEPWPKPQPVPPQETVPSTSGKEAPGSEYRKSPLYSTARPTLDEFLRTDYLMIPQFLMQVNKARKAASDVENKGLVKNLKSAQETGNCINEEENSSSVCSTHQDRSFRCMDNTDETKTFEKKAVHVNETASLATHVADKLSTAVSRCQIISNKITAPPSLRPKQRVKKVMKGGSLVTIPAPQPKIRSVNVSQVSPEGTSTATTSDITPECGGCMEKGLELFKKSSLEETVNETHIKVTNNNHSRASYQENANIHTKPKISAIESNQLKSDNSLKDKQSAVHCKVFPATLPQRKDDAFKQNIEAESEVHTDKTFCGDESLLKDFVIKERRKDNVNTGADKNDVSFTAAKVAMGTNESPIEKSGFKVLKEKKVNKECTENDNNNSSQERESNQLKSENSLKDEQSAVHCKVFPAILPQRKDDAFKQNVEAESEVHTDKTFCGDESLLKHFPFKERRKDIVNAGTDKNDVSFTVAKEAMDTNDSPIEKSVVEVLKEKKVNKECTENDNSSSSQERESNQLKSENSLKDKKSAVHCKVFPAILPQRKDDAFKQNIEAESEVHTDKTFCGDESLLKHFPIKERRKDIVNAGTDKNDVSFTVAKEAMDTNDSPIEKSGVEVLKEKKVNKECTENDNSSSSQERESNQLKSENSLKDKKSAVHCKVFPAILHQRKDDAFKQNIEAESEVHTDKTFCGDESLLKHFPIKDRRKDIVNAGTDKNDVSFTIAKVAMDTNDSPIEKSGVEVLKEKKVNKECTENGNSNSPQERDSNQLKSENSLKDKKSAVHCKVFPAILHQRKDDAFKQNIEAESEVHTDKTFCGDESLLKHFPVKEGRKDIVNTGTDNNGVSFTVAKVAMDTNKSPIEKSGVEVLKEKNMNKECTENDNNNVSQEIATRLTKHSNIDKVEKLPHVLSIVTSKQRLHDIEKVENNFAKECIGSDKKQAEVDNPLPTGIIETIAKTMAHENYDNLGEYDGDITDKNKEDNKGNTAIAIDNERNTNSVIAVVTCINDNSEGKVADGCCDVRNGCVEGDDDDDDYDDEGCGEDSGDRDDDDDHEVVGEPGEDADTRQNSVSEDDEDYAELVMDDSDTDEDEEEDYSFVLGNASDDTDEEEDEVKSDYEPEDMNLDSDTEFSVGGITFYHDTTVSRKRKRLRNKRLKRKAKNQKRNSQHKKAKAEKKSATGKNSSELDPSKGKVPDKKQMHPMSSKPPVPQVGPKKQLELEIQKATETSSNNQKDTIAIRNKTPVQSSVEEGSLLSMVSFCAVDVAVAASEKLAIKRSRGGQHAKKLKKAKRRAAALERIRNGEPHPRHAARRETQPKPICSYYIHGKCRKGEECPFRHVKSALIKKQEICKFYATDSCYLGDNCVYMHNSFPCKFFHIGHNCWNADGCKFSHDPLTLETWRLLLTTLDPSSENSVQPSQMSNFTEAGTPTCISSQQVAVKNLSSENSSLVSVSSSYNLRESTRKRSLSTSEAGSDHVTVKKREIPHEEGRDETGSFFVPGIYKDMLK